MHAPILQARLPDDLRRQAAEPLPRMRPVDGPWITVDDAYAAQIALRQHLSATLGEAVCRTLPGAEAAVAELLDVVIAALARHPAFSVKGDSVTCPDARVETIDRADPFGTLSRLVAEDLCLLDRRADQDEHVLVAASLAFPSGWTLAEKIGRPLMRIHAPVPPYDDDIGRRVQRFFDGVRPGRPMWRANLHGYGSADLHDPRVEGGPRRRVDHDPPFLRSERQTVLRLPRTGAVLFAIHTTVVRADTV